jgi:2',3'-cyclic-nucleotide 2'-phosphodiesterase (5'-nucleotidase family)
MKKINFKQFLRLSVLIFSLTFFISCSNSDNNPVDTNNPPVNNNVTVTLLHTNDEHGWMEPASSYGGAAGLMGLWKNNENFNVNDPFLILSGGDMWTGPAISTWFKGESMVEVMNAMNYTAAAIGNHEFDYKIDILEQRLSEADFPFLSANIRYKGTNNIPDFIKPYLIKTISGITFGIIGLTTTSTPYSAFPENVKDFDFIPYADALNQFVPEMKNQGAEFIIVNGHICVSEMQALVSTAVDLEIAIMTGGHCHEQYSNVSNGVLLIESGAQMEGYTRVTIEYDTLNNTTTNLIPDYFTNTTGTPDPAIQSIVENWRQQTDNALSEVIGFASQEIPKNSVEMYNMIADSWLYSFPNSDVSISNKGGVRQSIPAGDITLGTIVGILPFDNSIIELQLTGTQLINSINSSLFVGGMTTAGGYYLSDGSEVDGSSTYSVLITDYMYQSYTYFTDYDSNPYTTNVNFRQPLIDWIKSLNTSQSDPLNNYLDSVGRE